MSTERDRAQPTMDWQQVALNGGPPCFHVEGPQYCGRAERWAGHGNAAFHNFISLSAALATARREGEEAYANCRQVQERGEHSSVTCACVLTVEKSIRKEVEEATWAKAVKVAHGLTHRSEVSDSRWNSAIIHVVAALESAKKGEGG